MPFCQPAIEVLLLEDNPDDVFLFKAALKRQRETRFHVIHTDRLSTALKWLEELSPDIIVTDLNLPDSLGILTVMQLVRSSQEVPVVALTGWEDPVLGGRLIDKGASAFWSKDRLADLELPRAIVQLARNHAKG